MNKMAALGVSFLCACVLGMLWNAMRMSRHFDGDATTFVLYWAMMYCVFHDKKKDE